MSVIEFLQDHNSTFLTVVFNFFNFLFSIEGAVIIIGVTFLVCNKKSSYKLALSFLIAIFLSDILLKNIFNVARPYMVNDELYAIREVGSMSLPSTSLVLSSIFSSFVMLGLYKSLGIEKKKTKIIISTILVVSLVFLNVMVSLSKLYFAQNYIIDLVLGFIIGKLVFVAVHKLPSFESSPYYLMLLILPLIAVLVYSPHLLQLGYIRAFRYAGAFTSIVVGLYLERKYIRYRVANNLLTISIKLLIMLVVLLPCHLLLLWLLVQKPIVQFTAFLILGAITTLLLPLIFKFIDKYAYVFSREVDADKIIFSSISLSPSFTHRLAKKLSKHIAKGDTVLLEGDLGAGKSELVRSYLKYSGVNNIITSPTFTIVNVHDTPNTRFYHFDMYRLNDEAEVENIGFEEMIGESDAIKFIEWPDKVSSYLPKKYKKITIVKLGKRTRNIILEDYTS